MSLNIAYDFMPIFFSMSITLPFLVDLYNAIKFLANFYCQCTSGPLVRGLKMIKPSIMSLSGMWKCSISCHSGAVPLCPSWPRLTAPSPG